MNFYLTRPRYGDTVPLAPSARDITLGAGYSGLGIIPCLPLPCAPKQVDGAATSPQQDGASLLESSADSGAATLHLQLGGVYGVNPFSREQQAQVHGAACAQTPVAIVGPHTNARLPFNRGTLR